MLKNYDNIIVNTSEVEQRGASLYNNSLFKKNRTVNNIILIFIRIQLHQIPEQCFPLNT